MNQFSKTGVFKAIRQNAVSYIRFLSLILLILLFTSINANFLSAYNISNLLADIGPLLIIACGITFVLLTGAIDLSIGSICSCAAVMFTALLPIIGNFAYVAVIIYGIIAGLINGIIFTKIKVPSFIATLGTMSIWQSAAYLLSGGAPLQISKAYWDNIGWISIKFGVFSVPSFVSLLILLVFFIIQSKTKLGIQALAVGANERATRVAGVNTTKIKTLVFVVCGVCSSMSGLFLAAKLKSGIPIVGDPFTLTGVAAAVLGGTSLSGGKGGVGGTLLGALLVVIIQNGMDISAVDPFWKQIVFGVLVILAVYITSDRSSRDLVIK